MWLYVWGACEAYLFERMRHESLYVCNHVAIPGRFRPFNPMLFARRTLIVDKPDPGAHVRLFHCGNVDVHVNKRQVYHGLEVKEPVDETVVYGAALRPGANEIAVRIHSMGQPPTFAIPDGPLMTDNRWQVSCDAVLWDVPTCFPFEGPQCLPHLESFPVVELKPESVADGVYDFGKEVFGRPTFSAGRAGSAVVLDGESMEEACDDDLAHHEQHVGPLPVSPGVNEYPHELALRYLRIVSRADLRVRDVRLRSPVHPARYRGAFACCDEDLTRVWMHSAYTLRLCMRELFIDGIKRDRLPWVGDLYIGGLCNYFSFCEAQIVRHSLTALYGERPERVDLSGIIDYSMYWPMALRDYVLHTGDTAFLARARPLVERLIHALANKEDDHGLLPTDSMGWLFIDWAEVDHQGYSSNLHMLYVMALDAAAELMGLDGEADAADRIRRKADRVRQVCRRLFWDDGQETYVSNAIGDKPGEHVTRHAAALSILSGVARGEQLPHILDGVLLNPSVPPVGTPYMTAFEARALARCGRVPEMLDRIRGTWVPMLRAGASTFWEAWDPEATGVQHYAFYGRPFGKSLCHAWSAGPIFLLSSEMFAARPIEPGWKRFTVDPSAGGLAWAAVTVPTPFGDIDIHVDEEEAVATVPAGTVLDVHADPGRKTSFPGPCFVRRRGKTWERAG